MVGGQNLGSVATLGSGVPLHVMYELTKAHGKITVGGTASTVVLSGGYVQGGGHSALSPTFGLLADNCLGIYPLLLTLFLFHQRSFSEISVVIADGSLVTANSVENSDRTSNFLYVVPLSNILFNSLLGYARWWGWQLGCHYIRYFPDLPHF